MSVARRTDAATNATALAAAGLFARVLAWLAFVAFARVLGPGDLAVLALAASIGALVFEPGEGGVDPVAVRVLARGPHRETQRLGAALGAKGIVSTVGLVLGALAAVLLAGGGEPEANHERVETVLWFLAGVWCGGFGRTLGMLFQSRERFIYRGALEGARAVALVLGALAVASTDAGLARVGLVYFLAELTQAIVSVAIYRWRFGGGALRVRWRAVRNVLASAARPALAAELGIVYLLADHLVLWHFAPAEELGTYEAVQRIVIAMTLLPAAVTHSVFPALAARDPERGRRLYVASLRVLACGAWPLALGGAVVGPALVGVIYGPSFEEHARDFASIAFLSSGAMFLSYLPGSALVALGHTRPLLRISAALAVGNVAGNLVAVPLAGAKGAAVVMLTTQALGLVAYTRAAEGALGVERDPGRAGGHLRTILAAALCAVSAGLAPLPLPASIALGALVYAIALVWLRALPLTELGVLRQAPSELEGGRSTRSIQ